MLEYHPPSPPSVAPPCKKTLTLLLLVPRQSLDHTRTLRDSASPQIRRLQTAREKASRKIISLTTEAKLAARTTNIAVAAYVTFEEEMGAVDARVRKDPKDNTDKELYIRLYIYIGQGMINNRREPGPIKLASNALTVFRR